MLDRELLESEGLPRLREAVLVGRPTQALEIVDVVNDGNAAGKELEGDRSQGVRKVVTVDEVGSKLVDGGLKGLGRVFAEVPPALEELVARAVPPAQGFALVGEAESEVPMPIQQSEPIFTGCFVQP